MIFLDYEQNLFNSKNLGEGPEISQMGFGGYKNVTTLEGQRSFVLGGVETEESRGETWECLKGGLRDGGAF